MNAVAKRGFDLLRPHQVLIGSAVQENLHALAAGAELAHPIDETLGVPDRRHVGVGHQEDRVGPIQRGRDARIDHVAGVDDDVVVGAGQHPQQLLERAGVLGVRAVELLRAGQNVEAGFVLRHQLLQEVLVQAVQVLDRVEHRETRPHAEKERDFSQTRFQIDDDRRALRQAGELDAAVHRHRRRARAPLGAEKRVRHTRRLGAGRCRFTACRRAAHRPREGFFHGAGRLRAVDVVPGEELVRARAHRLQDQVGLRCGGYREDRQPLAARAESLDRRHAGRSVGADVDDDQVGTRSLGVPSLDDADRYAAGAQQASHLPLEFVVIADDLRRELGHV